MQSFRSLLPVNAEVSSFSDALPLAEEGAGIKASAAVRSASDGGNQKQRVKHALLVLDNLLVLGAKAQYLSLVGFEDFEMETAEIDFIAGRGHLAGDGAE